jgi:hypothetical protein
LEASPAEGASYSMARKDKELYPDIIVANDTAIVVNARSYALLYKFNSVTS